MTSTAWPNRLSQFALQNTTLIMFVVILLFFGLQAPGYLGTDNILNIVKQAAYTGIVAVGMIFVLLSGGIDLSVSSNMYLSPLVAGLLMRQIGLEVLPAMIVALAVGALIGLINAFCVVQLRIVPFIATLSMLIAARGLGTALTQSVSLDFPPPMLEFGRAVLIGIPLPIAIFGIVVLVAHFILSRTAFGRQLYAVGNDPEAAKKAGINTGRVMALAYILCGVCAALGGFTLAAAIMRLDQPFAEGREFAVIAAAVLGGTSLFGGVGNAFGAVIGAVLVQMVQTGLVFLRVNLYLQPMVQATIIFLAVFFDALRGQRMARLKRRYIRSEA